MIEELAMEETMETYDDDATARRRDRLISDAISNCDQATAAERAALDEIYDVEGFGGAEDRVETVASAVALILNRLKWYRDMRTETTD